MIWIVFPRFPLPTSPVAALDPFRIANRYGLFAVMTRGRYEIEFQGSNDGQNWVAYPFRYKPQDPSQRAGQSMRLTSRASIGTCGSRRWDRGARTSSCPAPRSVYWLALPMCWRCLPETRFPRLRRSRFVPCFGNTGSPRWRRSAPQECGGSVKLIGLYAPVLERLPDGKVGVVQWPEPLPPRQ